MFTLPPDFLANSLQYSKDFVNDLKLPILIILAISFGLIIFSAITGFKPSDEEE